MPEGGFKKLVCGLQWASLDPRVELPRITHCTIVLSAKVRSGDTENRW